MTHLTKVNMILDLVYGLQTYVRTRGDAGLYDIAASVEVLLADILKTVDGLNLRNANQVKASYPAIDLADDENRIAVQVTLNVTTEKWTEAVKTFQDPSHGLQAKYDTLRIIGFCDAVKPQKGKLPTGVTVEKPSSFLGKLKTLQAGDLTDLEHKLRESFDFAKVHPLQDKHCFDVVFSVVRRSALQHLKYAEGDYGEMKDGLAEITKIITEGKLEAKDLYAKPFSYYSEPYSKVLELVISNISKIMGELNKAKSGGMYLLSPSARDKVDSLKKETIDAVNAFCANNGHQGRLEAIE